MKPITNQRKRPRQIAETGQVAGPEETVEVDDDLADRLCLQPDNWKPATRKQPSKKTVKRRQATTEEGDR